MLTLTARGGDPTATPEPYRRENREPARCTPADTCHSQCKLEIQRHHQRRCEHEASTGCLYAIYDNKKEARTSPHLS
ncbi:MAG: hypothetical protein AAFV33_07240 [Chloroflexota bacterium]